MYISFYIIMLPCCVKFASQYILTAGNWHYQLWTAMLRDAGFIYITDVLLVSWHSFTDMRLYLWKQVITWMGHHHPWHFILTRQGNHQWVQRSCPLLHLSGTGLHLLDTVLHLGTVHLLPGLCIIKIKRKKLMEAGMRSGWDTSLPYHSLYLPICLNAASYVNKHKNVKGVSVY